MNVARRVGEGSGAGIAGQMLGKKGFAFRRQGVVAFVQGVATKNRILGVGGALGVLALVGALAAPAQAAEGRSLGPKTCSISVATQARANGSQVHYINSNYKTFAYSSTYVTRTYYSGVKVANSTYVEVSGAISSASVFCDY